MVARPDAHRPFPAWRPGAHPRQAGVGAALVDEHEGGRVERGDLRPPGGPGSLVPLAGGPGLFVSGQPARASERAIVAALTRTPCARSHRAPCSASVASGVARTWANSGVSWAEPMRRGRPRRGKGATPPVSRRRRCHHSTVAGPTPRDGRPRLG